MVAAPVVLTAAGLSVAGSAAVGVAGAAAGAAAGKFFKK